MIPDFIANDLGMDDGEKILFGRLLDLSMEKGFCESSNTFLSELCRVSEREIQKRLEVLDKKGYVIRKTTKKGFVWTRKIYPAYTPPNSFESSIVRKKKGV